MKIQHQIPEFYSLLLPEVLLKADLQETKATCGDCAMTRDKRGARARLTYQADLKCCTFEPWLPNYLVGAVLAHADRFAFGARVFKEKIKTRGYALPLGCVPPIGFQVEFNSREKHEFGNRADWLCPYYDQENQNCGIWKYRGSVCTTFFCQSDRGDRGLRFWSRMLEYLNVVEMSLSEEILVELDFSPRQVSACLDYLNVKSAPSQKRTQRVLPLPVWKQLWNGYDRDIEGFYLRCYEKVKQWDRDRFQESLGSIGRRQEKRLLGQLERVLEGSL